MRAYWLSFASPETGKSLGVCVVEVTEEEAEAIKPTLPATALPGAEWVGAACRKAWQMGCNPGGEVAAWDITAAIEEMGIPEGFKMDRLYSGEEIEAFAGGFRG